MPSASPAGGEGHVLPRERRQERARVKKPAIPEGERELKNEVRRGKKEGRGSNTVNQGKKE